jgi:cell fate regulator YaaT (PSP1 superfamily)
MKREKKSEKKPEKKKGIYLVHGATRPGRAQRILKGYEPLPRGTYALVEMPDSRKEVFYLDDFSYSIPMDIEGLPTILRKANPKEVANHKKRLELEDKGKEFCKQFAKELGLEMKLVDVECYFDRSKIIFYYTAEGRIDFRELVKQLAKALRMRIEMRQIGVRNETGLLGGIGYCGKEFCCAQYLKNFQPLTIKMAKEQGLILDPNKISGPCGRLLCCLAYEESWYRECLASLPRLGSKISLGEENFRILKYNFFQRTVALEKEDGTILSVSFEELKNFVLKEELPEEPEEGLRDG